MMASNHSIQHSTINSNIFVIIDFFFLFSCLSLSFVLFSNVALVQLVNKPNSRHWIEPCYDRQPKHLWDSFANLFRICKKKMRNLYNTQRDHCEINFRFMHVNIHRKIYQHYKYSHEPKMTYAVELRPDKSIFYYLDSHHEWFFFLWIWCIIQNVSTFSHYFSDVEKLHKNIISCFSEDKAIFQRRFLKEDSVELCSTV